MFLNRLGGFVVMCLFIKLFFIDLVVLGVGGKSSKGVVLVFLVVLYKIGLFGLMLWCIMDVVDFESGDEGGDIGGEGGGFGCCILKFLLFCVVMFMFEFMLFKGVGLGGDRRWFGFGMMECVVDKFGVWEGGDNGFFVVGWIFLNDIGMCIELLLEFSWLVMLGMIVWLFVGW